MSQSRDLIKKSKPDRRRKSPIDREAKDFLEKLVIGIGELSVTTGISMRRIRYLQEEGHIKCVPGTESSTRRFDYANVRKLLALDKLVNKEGYQLKVAVAKLDHDEKP